jgi:NAD-dependent dihydropyrimidine dehydrogenase PreA subunit
MSTQPGAIPRSCRPEPIERIAVVDPNRCEAKGDCVTVCPYDVFELRALSAEERSGLSLVGRLRYVTHGRRSSTTPRIADCHACGLCVAACPEDAIKLIDRRPPSQDD